MCVGKGQGLQAPKYNRMIGDNDGGVERDSFVGDCFGKIDGEEGGV